jgi:hypothetical protein
MFNWLKKMLTTHNAGYFLYFESENTNGSADDCKPLYITTEGIIAKFELSDGKKLTIYVEPA